MNLRTLFVSPTQVWTELEREREREREEVRQTGRLANRCQPASSHQERNSAGKVGEAGPSAQHPGAAPSMSGASSSSSPVPNWAVQSSHRPEAYFPKLSAVPNPVLAQCPAMQLCSQSAAGGQRGRPAEGERERGPKTGMRRGW